MFNQEPLQSEKPEIKDLEIYEMALELLKLDRSISNLDLDLIEDTMSKLDSGLYLTSAERTKLKRIYNRFTDDEDDMDEEDPYFEDFDDDQPA